jgi:hypothetical protein
MGLFAKLFSTETDDLPRFPSLDQGISYLMRHLRGHSERLGEYDFYVGQRWREVRDDLNFQEKLLHVFKPDGTYLRILEGDIASGSWEHTLGGLVLNFHGKHELYELVFLNDEFFILTKYGDHKTKGAGKTYWMLAKEPLVNRYEWPELLSLMYEIYKVNTNYMSIVFLFFIIVGIVVFFSIM